MADILVSLGLMNLLLLTGPALAKPYGNRRVDSMLPAPALTHSPLQELVGLLLHFFVLLDEVFNGLFKQLTQRFVSIDRQVL